MIEKLVSLLPFNPSILDAACGTGKYWQLLKDNNCVILGVDHSAGMLAQAKRKFPDVPFQKVKLYTLDFKEKFNAVICMDAMENIFPEHWLIVLQNFYNACKPDGYIYFTVELLSNDKLEMNFNECTKNGIPVVRGEFLENGGYHYYPTLAKVNDWIKMANLKIIEEAEEGVYHHYLTKK